MLTYILNSIAYTGLGFLLGTLARPLLWGWYKKSRKTKMPDNVEQLLKEAEREERRR